MMFMFDEWSFPGELQPQFDVFENFPFFIVFS